MSESMRAAIFKGSGRMELEERPKPVARAGEVLVRIRAAGICGSDVHGFEGLIPDRRKPGLIMGHEAAGEVAETGDGVSRWKPGDRVAIDPQIPCGVCVSCLRGWRHICNNRINLGSAMNSWYDGTLCEFIALPEIQLHALPDDVGFGEGSVVEPAACAAHIFNRSLPEVGSSIVIIGTGTIGLIAVQVARAMGAARLVAVDRVASRLEMAAGFGADLLVDTGREDPVERILAETDGLGADVVAEAAGTALTYDWAVRSVRKRGSVLALGYVDERVPFPMRTLIFREINVVGCTGFTFESDTVLELMSRGRIDVKPLITHEFPLDRVQEAFETAADPASGAIKVVVYP